mmetsp:Transcript_19433/g.73425  ORF Transcript_19433/g.73425 Transcript_19433/m.73425 type:complete len:313 (-) Transcript_19433:97-1035(-)
MPLVSARVTDLWELVMTSARMLPTVRTSWMTSPGRRPQSPRLCTVGLSELRMLRAFPAAGARMTTWFPSATTLPRPAACASVPALLASSLANSLGRSTTTSGVPWEPSSVSANTTIFIRSAFCLWRPVATTRTRSGSSALSCSGAFRQRSTRLSGAKPALAASASSVSGKNSKTLAPLRRSTAVTALSASTKARGPSSCSCGPWLSAPLALGAASAATRLTSQSREPCEESMRKDLPPLDSTKRPPCGARVSCSTSSPFGIWYLQSRRPSELRKAPTSCLSLATKLRPAFTTALRTRPRFFWCQSSTPAWSS